MLFYFKEDIHQLIETDLEVPLKFLSVHFSFVHVHLEDDKWSLKNENKPLKLNSMQELKEYYSISDDFKKLVETWSLKLPSYEFYCKMLLQALLYKIYDNKTMQNTNYSTGLKVEKVIKYMNENINGNIKLNDLAQLVALSNAYLSRTFKEITGYSVIEFSIR